MEASLCLLRLASALKTLTDFVFASSSSVYGSELPPPWTEDMPRSPTGIYSQAKLQIERACSSMLPKYVRVTVLRLFSVYGEEGRPYMAPLKFMKRIANNHEVPVLGDGSAYRDFTYIGDVVSAFVAAWKKRRQPGNEPTTAVANNVEVINVGTGRTTAVSELIAILSNVVGALAKVVYLDRVSTDLPGTQADASKLERVLKLRASTTIKPGVQRMYQNHIEVQSDDNVRVVALIATIKDRQELLCQRSLHSVARQSRLPDTIIIVVGDRDDQATKAAIAEVDR